MRKITRELGSDSARRLMLYSAAAGMGAFGFGYTAQAGITVVDLPDIGVQNAARGWLTGNVMAYDGQSWGIDILQDGGTLDIGFFQGTGYGGYLVGRTDVIGYVTPYGNIGSSGQVKILSNDTELPDTGPVPGGSDKALQGFLAGQIIGDGNDADGVDPGQNTMRDAYYPSDWEAGNGVPSYVGFKIDIDNNGSFDGFGWIEAIIDEVNGAPVMTITRWAYTDDGSTIAAGQVPEPSSLMLLAAGAGALGVRRRKDAS